MEHNATTDNRVSGVMVSDARKANKIHSHRAKYVYALSILTLCFVMLLTLSNDLFFESDEGEIFSKGSCIVQGQLLYKDFASQHMPVAYYVAALFSALGASSVLTYRLCFYGGFALIWALILIWYGDKIPKLSIVTGAVLYIIQTSRISLGTSILSEHFQSIGIAILFFELVYFNREKKLSFASCVRISLAIFLSFGSAFTSIFPIFFLVLTVVALEIKNRILFGNESGWNVWGRKMARRYLTLAGVVAVPFVILCVYYLFTGSLDDFYYWSYKFNIDIYSKYQATGGSVLYSMFSGFRYILDPVKAMFTDSNMMFLGIMTALSLLSAIIIGVLHKSIILPVGLILMLNGCETRGSIISFHSMHAIMLQSVMLSYIVGILISRISRRRMRSLATATALILVLMLFADRWQKLPQSLSFTDVGQSDYYDNVDFITEEGERIGISTLQEGVYVYTKTVPASVVSATVKWMWDGAGQEAMRQLRANPPRVYILDEDYAVWGYPLKDYAQELIDFVHENYTPLSQLSLGSVYVLNSYYQEAYDILSSILKDKYAEVGLEVTDQATITIDSLKVSNNRIEVGGWAVVHGQSAKNVRVYILARYKDKSFHLFRTNKENRSDVVSALNNDLYLKSGFRGGSDVPPEAELEENSIIIVVERDGRFYIDANEAGKAREWGLL